jgi:hypothetical protein
MQIMRVSVGGIVPAHYEVLVWGSISVVVIVALGFGLFWFRRRYHPDSISDDNLSATFSMRSVEEMRDSGLISDDEFRRLRSASLGLDAPKCNNDNSVLSRPGDVDDGTEEPVSPTEPQDQDHKESKWVHPVQDQGLKASEATTDEAITSVASATVTPKKSVR